MRNLVILAAAAVLFSVLLFGCAKREAVGPEAKPSIDAKTAQAMKGQTCPVDPNSCSTQKIEVRNTKGENKKFFEAVMKDDDVTVGKMLKTDKKFLGIRNIKNATPLHVAAKLGMPKCAALLIKGGADVNAVNDEGRTPLHAASTHDHLNVIKMLVEHGAKVSAASNNLGTPLHDAVVMNHMEIVKYLIAKGANIDAATKGGVTPLIAALTRKRNDIAKYLIDKGAKFDMAKLQQAMSGNKAALKGLPKGEFCCEKL